jgi:hypothetical protein
MSDSDAKQSEAENAGHKGHRQTWQQRWHATSLPNKLMAGATLTVAIAAFVNLGVAIGQWWIMGKQLDQMVGSSNFSERQAILAIGQLAVANRNATSAQQQAKAAQDSVRTIQQQFALAQRPWIEVDTGIGIHQGDVWVGSDGNGQPIVKHPSELMKFPNQIILGNFGVAFTGTFRNVGLSPAVNEWQIIQMKFIDLPGQINAGYSNITMPSLRDCAPDAHRPKTNFVAFQNFPYSFSTDQIPSEVDIEGWLKFRKMLVIYGCIKYDDQMGGRHQTDFCSVFDRFKNPIQWGYCPAGNRAW